MELSPSGVLSNLPGWAPAMPEDMHMLQAMAGTLETSWADLSFLALMADLGAPRQ